jgi:hypothetical protein
MDVMTLMVVALAQLDQPAGTRALGLKNDTLSHLT